MYYQRMNVDCDNSSSNEASGPIDSALEADPQGALNETKSKDRWFKRLGILGAIGIAAWFWFNPPLNQAERKLVGSWERSESPTNTTISKYVITYNADRTWFLDFKSEIPAKNGKPAEVHQGAAYGKWKLKRGIITLDADRTATGRSRLLVGKFLNALRGKKFIDPGLDQGKIQASSLDEIRVRWYDPVAEAYDPKENTWMRIE